MKARTTARTTDHKLGHETHPTARALAPDRLFPSRRAGIWIVLALAGMPLAHADFDGGINAYGMGNFELARREFAASAAQGEAQGQYYLGLLYEEGQGVPLDYQQAWQWYTKAAAQGDVDAAFALGRMYSQGVGVPRDLVAAYGWYSRAARGGHYLGKQERDRCAGQLTPAQLDQARQGANP